MYVLNSDTTEIVNLRLYDDIVFSKCHFDLLSNIINNKQCSLIFKITI